MSLDSVKRTMYNFDVFFSTIPSCFGIFSLFHICMVCGQEYKEQPAKGEMSQYTFYKAIETYIQGTSQ